MSPNPQETDEEILNGNLYFLCNEELTEERSTLENTLAQNMEIYVEHGK